MTGIRIISMAKTGVHGVIHFAMDIWLKNVQMIHVVYKSLFVNSGLSF